MFQWAVARSHIWGVNSADKIYEYSGGGEGVLLIWHVQLLLDVDSNSCQDFIYSINHTWSSDYQNEPFVFGLTKSSHFNGQCLRDRVILLLLLESALRKRSLSSL
jgi:hypothetical protein